MNTHQFYNTISTCGNTAVQCPNTLNSHSSGWIPRGFFTRVNSSAVDVLAVCKNPGHLLPNESDLYRRTSFSELAKTHMQHAAVTFQGGNITNSNDLRSTVFHRNLRRYMSFILDVDQLSVFDHMVYTNLVKCSTRGERDKLDIKTMSECFSRHFVREIDFFKPKVLIAFGREVESFLIRMRERGAHSLPVVYLKHPSYYYRKDIEGLELARAKSEVSRWI